MVMMIFCLVLLLLCFVLLLMLRMKMKTLSPVLLLMLLMKMKILCPAAVAHALDDDDAALFLLYKNDHVLPCTEAHAHDDDDALLLLLLVMMICFLLLLMSLCHTHPDFFKHHRKHVQTYERRHVDKRQTNHLLTSMFIDVSFFLEHRLVQGLFWVVGRICTQLICTHDHALDYHVGSKTKWKEVDQDACQEKLTH